MNFDNMINQVIEGDCLEVMKDIKDNSIDMVLCDLPYGTTHCKWDICLDLKKLWKEYERICKENAAIVLFGSQPFTTDIINSNRKLFRYEWIWNKNISTGFLNAKKMPLKIHENILVFYKKLPKYFPQKYIKETKTLGKTTKRSATKKNIYNNMKDNIYYDDGERYPNSVLYFDQDAEKKNSNIKNKISHSTQKPLDLCRYLILTYTEVGDTVLDNCAGSGTTGRAAKDLNRKFILIEKEKRYYEMCKKRLKQETLQLK